MPITVAGTNITMNDSTVQATAFLGMRATVFTANGTFTIPTGITAIKITVVGGGGGSGGGGSGGCCASYLGGAGAGGGAAIKYLTNVQNLNKRGDKRYVAFTKGKFIKVVSIKRASNFTKFKRKPSFKVHLSFIFRVC